MAAFITLKQDLCPRDKAVQLMFDIDPANTEPHFVGSYYKGLLYRLIQFSDAKLAAMELEDEVSRPGPEGDSSWLSVLARCQNKVPEAGVWVGSPAEYAARFAAIGTYEWVMVLKCCREAAEEIATLKNNNNRSAHGSAIAGGTAAG